MAKLFPRKIFFIAQIQDQILKNTQNEPGLWVGFFRIHQFRFWYERLLIGEFFKSIVPIVGLQIYEIIDAETRIVRALPALLFRCDDENEGRY
jgi:hypothetical protein